MPNRSQSPLGSNTSLQHLHSSCIPSCIVNRCRRGTCSVVSIFRRTVCIDCDICQTFTDSTSKKPDFILLHSENTSTEIVWLVVEMKSRAGHITDIIEQLQA